MIIEENLSLISWYSSLILCDRINLLLLFLIIYILLKYDEEIIFRKKKLKIY